MLLNPSQLTSLLRTFQELLRLCSVKVRWPPRSRFQLRGGRALSGLSGAEFPAQHLTDAP